MHVLLQTEARSPLLPWKSKKF